MPGWPPPRRYRQEAAFRRRLDRDRITGRVAHGRVPTLTASADVCCFPSRTGTFGNAVREAQVWFLLRDSPVAPG